MIVYSVSPLFQITGGESAGKDCKKGKRCYIPEVLDRLKDTGMIVFGEK